MYRIGLVAVLGLVLVATGVHAQEGERPAWMEASMVKLDRELTAKYGTGEQQRLQRGMEQVVGFWRIEDGAAPAFEDFVRTHFAGDRATLDAMFDRYEYLLEQLDGHMNKSVLELRRQADLDLGPIMPFDEVFSAYDPAAHLSEDFFQNRIAFIALLNFPLSTLEQRITEGEQWNRRQWAETRLAQRFARRIPAEVNQAIAAAQAESDQYIAEYNIWMHHLVDDNGNRLFPAKLRLLSHWNLRDEIKACYSLADSKTAMTKQRMIQKVMERIVTQTIPEVVVNNPHVDWNPFANTVTASTANDGDTPTPDGLKPNASPEPDTRYRVLLSTFLASKKADPYSPTAPTLIARQFNENRELPEPRVEAMLKEVLTSPLVPRVAALIRQQLGRPLEPFDVWYNGFKARGTYTEAQLDEMVAKKYPTAAAFEKDLPNILVKLGFSAEKANYLADNIVVDPARGSGHAWGPRMRSEKAHLRTRVGASGMNYKGFNIAVHELGHNVEQIFSLKEVDHTLLSGVPNTAFTEALAFVFQGHDLELLGLTKPDVTGEARNTLNDFWGTYEIAGVALVDMAVWHWMYDHPSSTPAELREATLGISRGIWNTYYAPVFGTKDVVLPGIYSHMIHSFLYLPDYPIGHLIAHQVEEQMKKAGALGTEFERITRTGSVGPDLWMKTATGSPVGAGALLDATERSLKELEKGGKK
jgi:hypothetical protein